MHKIKKTWIAFGAVLLQLFTIFSPAALAVQPLSADDIAVDAVHFPDKAFRDWILNPNHLNGFGSDGTLTAEERNQITQMDLSDQNIENLTGIEHFPALTVLYCSRNRLTSLDVSQNTLLEELYCSSNQLTQLDLSQNPNLRSLYCASNFLTELHIENCSQLKSLNCEKNRLKELDLSGNPELIQLYSRHNQLTQLDVSHNKKLVFIETFDNQLTSFDCTMLSDLEFLHIDYNKLTSLDMSQNPNLKGNGFVAANNQLNELTMPNIPGVTIEANVFYEQNPKQGYETVRWFYDPMYAHEVQETDRIPADGQKLYAKWIANPYTVNYHPNGGQGEMMPQAVEYDQKFSLTPNAFTRIGYLFQNWNTASDAVGGRTYTDNQEVVNLGGKNPNQDQVTLYAQWKANTYTIRYHANGGEGSMDDTAAVYDQPVSLSPNRFTKADFVLVGWSLESGDQNPKAYVPEETVRNLTSVNGQVVDLYAVWISHAEIQQYFLDELSQLFDGYRQADYYLEDWEALQQIRLTAAEAISDAGAEEAIMRQALQTASSQAMQINTKEQRAEQIVQEWETVHSEILSRLDGPVPMDQMEEYRSQMETAISQSDAAWLAQQSALTDPESRQDAVQRAQNQMDSSIQKLYQMQRALAWLDGAKDWYQVPMGSVKSTDVGHYADQMDAYNRLTPEEKAFCDPAIPAQLLTRKYFAQEKQNALKNLDTYFATLEWTDYTEENQKKLIEIRDKAKEDMENADVIGMADRLLLESIDQIKAVQTIVRQKVPSIIVKPTASALTKGQTLSDSRLTGGQAETEGTFTWKDGSVIPTKTQAHLVVFTPKDSKGYLPVEFYVTVSVEDPSVPKPPSSPDTDPDTDPDAPPAESTPANDPVSAPDDSSLPEQSVGPDSADSDSPSDSSDVSAAEPGSESEGPSPSQEGTQEPSEEQPEQEQPKAQNGLNWIVLTGIGAAVVVLLLVLAVQKRK